MSTRSSASQPYDPIESDTDDSKGYSNVRTQSTAVGAGGGPSRKSSSTRGNPVETKQSRKKETLVKATKKSTVDKTRGQYAPISTPSTSTRNSLPQDSDSESDFSPPPAPSSRSSRRQQPQVTALDPQSQAELAERAHEESSQEEEEKSAPDMRDRKEKKRRTMWALIIGGISIVVIIVIVVIVIMLHSPSSSTDSTSLNSTIAETDHSDDSTSSSLTGHSTSSLINGSSLAEHETASPNSLSVDISSSSTATLDDASSTDTLDLTPTTALDHVSTDSLDSSATSVSDQLVTSTLESFQSSPTSFISLGLSSEAIDDNEDTQPSPAATQPSDQAISQTGSFNLSPSIISSQPQETLALDSSKLNPTLSPTSIVDYLNEGEHPTLTLETLQSKPTIFVDPLIDNGSTDDTSPDAIAETPTFDPAILTNRPSAPDQITQPVILPFFTASPSTTASSASPTMSPSQNTTKYVGTATAIDSEEAVTGCESLELEESDFFVTLAADIFDDTVTVCGALVHVWNESTNQTRTAQVKGFATEPNGPTDIQLDEALFNELAEQDDDEELKVQWWFEYEANGSLITADLSKYESTAKSTKSKPFDTTAIFWKNDGWEGACGKKIDHDDLYLALPLALWSDPTAKSPLCGRTVEVKNVATEQTLELEIVDASNRTEYSTMTKSAFEQLGGDLDAGELAVTLSLLSA